jgi:Predicted nucleotide-binding protein containing TIR-like domain
MGKPSLFIGSSTEGLEFARALRALLVYDAEVTLWNEGLFSLGNTFIETLVNSLPRFDFAVLVLTPDDLVKSREVDLLGPRDNVLFELGLFMGRLGRSRTFILTQSNSRVKIPSDLSGMTTATYEWPRDDKSYKSAVGPAGDSIRELIRDLGVSDAKTAREISNIGAETAKLTKGLSDQKQELDNQRQKLDEQQQAINMLVEYTMSASIFNHLCGIALLKTYDLDYGESNKRELYFLRDHGFIQPRYGEGFLDFQEGRHNVADIAAPTPIGTAYVKLRNPDIPQDMRKDQKNLRQPLAEFLR